MTHSKEEIEAVIERFKEKFYELAVDGHFMRDGQEIILAALEAYKQQQEKAGACCCPEGVTFGDYQNQVELKVPDTVSLYRNTPEREKRETVCIDACLEVEIRGLWAMGIATTGCCCGHNMSEGYIGVEENFIPQMKALGYKVRHNELYPDAEDGFYPKTIRQALTLRSEPQGVDVEHEAPSNFIAADDDWMLVKRRNGTMEHVMTAAALIEKGIIRDDTEQ